MPGGVWAQQIRAGSVGGYGVQAPKPASPFDTANQYLRGGGSSSDFGRGVNAVVKRQFADVGKANINLLDPLAMSRGAVNYQPVDGQDGGLLGIGNYYNPQQPGGLFAGLFGGIAQTVGGIFGEEAAKTGSEIGAVIGKTIEAPLAIVGSAGLPFVAPVIDSVNSEIEKATPYILRDTLKIPTNVGGAFQSLLNIFGLAGMAVERTYAGMDARGALPEDIEARLASGELKSRDEAFDEMVLTSRGYSNDVLHNLAWNLLLDPANWASLGVGMTGGAVRATGKLARTFSSTMRAEPALAQSLIAKGGRLGEVAAAATREEAITGMVDSRGLIAQMRNVIDDSTTPFHLSYIERLGMSALGPVSAETGNVVAKVGNYILRATDPVNFFSGSKAGQRSMAFLTTAASTGAMAAYKAPVVLGIAKLADQIGGGGSERVYRSIGINGANGLQEVGLSDLATSAMQSGAIPRTGKLDPVEAVREILRGGGYDSNIGKYVELQIERNKDISVGMLPYEEMKTQTHNKFAALLGVDVGKVAAVMKTVSSDQAILIHALYYYTKGEALHTTVLHALRDAKVAGKLNSTIDPERVAIISSRTLTNVTVKAVDDALAKGDVGALRQEMEKYNDFNWVHNKNVPDSELRETVEQWLDTNRPHLVQEVDLIDPATGQPLTNIPDELSDWARDGDTFGYKLGQKMPGEVPEEALWRITRAPGKDGEILNANPYSDFWVEGGDSARALNRFTATKMAMTRGIRQERIIWSQRRRFITDMAAGSKDGGVDIPPALADRIFKALMYEARDRYIQPRGLEPKEMYNTARRVLDDARKSNGAYNNLATKLTERQVVLTLLRATQGEVALVGVTQKITGGVKAFAPGSGANYWGRISERLYPLMRFTLNPVFQTMEMTEPYILNSMRGIWTPLQRDNPVYQEALATRNAISQMAHHGMDNPDGLAAETAEALATQAYTGSQAAEKFGRNRFMRWMPNIGERKDVAAAMEAERIMGDHMYVAFEQILGPKFEAFWSDMERQFGETNRGRLAKRWMAANFALQDVNGFEVATIDDILKMRTIGKVFRLNKGGERGAYSWADVEVVFDHVRSYGGTVARRSERGLEPGEALLEDLRSMSREEWFEEVADSGLNTDHLTRISDTTADTIYRMANGPEVDEFWNGKKLPNGRRDMKTGFRNTYLQNVTGTDAVWTRVARDTEIAHARALVRGAALGKGMTEEEFIKLHFEDLPQEIADISEVSGLSLQEIREAWGTEAMRRGPSRPEYTSSIGIREETTRLDHPGWQALTDTQNAGGHYFLRVSEWYLDDIQDALIGGEDNVNFYDMPSRAYDDLDVYASIGDLSSVIVRVRRDRVGKLIDRGEGYHVGEVSIERQFQDPKDWEVLTPEGEWKPLQGGGDQKVKPPERIRQGNAELVTSRELYGPADPLISPSGEAYITQEDFEGFLTPEQKRHRDRYTQSGYADLNRWLRGQELEDPGYSDNYMTTMRDHVDQGLSMGQTREPVVLFRGIDVTEAIDRGEDLPFDLDELLEDGATFTDDAYFSTSKSESTARGFAGTSWGGEDHIGLVFTADVPAGTHIAWGNVGEQESILGRKTPWETVGQGHVTRSDNGIIYHIRIRPTGNPSSFGVNRLIFGDAPRRLRDEGRMLQDAVQNPAALRDRVHRPPLEGPPTGLALRDIAMDAETAIRKAEEARPPVQRTPEEALAAISSTLDSEAISAAGRAIADLRERIDSLLESEVWDYGAADPNARMRQVRHNNPDRMLGALGETITEFGSTREGLQRVLRVMERIWSLGPGAVIDPRADDIDKAIATHFLRGVTYGIEQGVAGNRLNDTVDALAGNVSRRQTGRIDSIQPIVADNSAARAAGYHVEDGAPAQAPAPVALPPAAPRSGAGIPTKTLEPTGAHLGGSTGAKQVRDPETGTLYVDKKGAHVEHIREESTADRVYEALGVPVAPHTLIEGAHPIKRAEMIEGATPYSRFIETASPEEVAAVDAQLQRGFALDSLLANWDVIGLEGDNVIVKNGVAYRIDNGGSLRWRAQGEAKGRFFGETVGELNTLRDPDLAEWGTRVFGSITDGAIRRQVLDLGEQLDTILANLPPDLRDTVRARYQSMLDQTAHMTPDAAVAREALPAPAAVAGPTPVKIGEYEHEYLVDYYNKLAQHANAVGFNGRGDWTAADIASVAGHAHEQQALRGGAAPSGVELDRAVVQIDMAITPGDDVLLDGMEPIWEILAQPRYRAEKHKVMRDGTLGMLRGVRDTLGLIIERGDEAGVGLFDGDDVSPLMSTFVLASGERIQTTMDVIAATTRQPRVRAFTIGPAARDITDFKQYTARANIIIEPGVMSSAMAERLAKRIGSRLPEAKNMVATKTANGGWMLTVMDDTGELFPRLDNGAVDNDRLQAFFEDLMEGKPGELPDAAPVASYEELRKFGDVLRQSVEAGAAPWDEAMEETFGRAIKEQYSSRKPGLQDALREGNPLTPEQQADADILDAASTRFTTTEPTILYRGIRKPKTGPWGNEDFMMASPEALVGMSFGRPPLDPATMRTGEGTTSVYRIHLPAGFKMGVTDKWDERLEVLLPRGLKWRTVAVHRDVPLNAYHPEQLTDVYDVVPDLGDAGPLPDVPGKFAVDYGTLYEAKPPKLPDGSVDWDGYARQIEADSTATGAPVRAADIGGVRSSYVTGYREAIDQAAPKQSRRLRHGDPPIGDTLEDRRGGNLLGVTSPRGANAAIIRGFAASDALTGVHELVHVFSIAGADPSLREVITKAFDEYRVADDAAKTAHIAILRQRMGATSSPSVRTRYRNQITALENGLQNPHPSDWGKEHEEFFVHLVYDWMGRGVPDNPELNNALNHFKNWLTVMKKELNQPGMAPLQVSPQMDAAMTKMFSRKGIDTVSYSVEQQTLRMAGQQVVRSAWDEAHATHYYKRDRSMAERSINHPYIGLYPASYMWGKILPEMLRFLALRPFGMETPFLAWNVAREVSDSVRAQAELDPGFKDWLEGNEDAFMLFSMLFPGLPHDIPANASLPVRRIAEQGLEAQKAYAMGVSPEEVKDIDFSRGSQDAIQYALGPLGTIRTASEVVGMGGDLVRSTIGSAQETFAGQEPLENLPLR